LQDLHTKTSSTILTYIKNKTHRSSGLLRGDAWLVTGFSGQSIAPIFKGRDGRPRTKHEIFKWSLCSPWSVFYIPPQFRVQFLHHETCFACLPIMITLHLIWC